MGSKAGNVRKAGSVSKSGSVSVSASGRKRSVTGNVFIRATHVCLQLLELLEETEYPVHSVYDSGFNMKAGRYLSFIGNKNNELLPFGICLAPEGFQTLRGCGVFEAQNLVEQAGFRGQAGLGGQAGFAEQPGFGGQSVFAEQPDSAVRVKLTWNQASGCLVFDRACICLDQAHVFDSRVPLYDLPRAGILTALSVLEPLVRRSFNAQTPRIPCLFRAISAGDAEAIKDCFQYYIGRGPGLTPSGDDMILGMVLMDMACRGREGIRPALGPILASCLRPDATTDASMSNFHAALEGLYCGSFLRFLEAVASNNRKEIQNAAASILRFGHHSGIDMLFGIFLQLKQLEM